MAISLVTGPEEYQPVRNPIQFVFSSTNVALCDFAYLCDVYIDGTFILTLKSFPEDDDYGYFTIESVLKSYMTYNYNPNLTGFDSRADSVLSYYVRVRERYNGNYASDCKGDVIDSAVLYTSSTFYAWNGGISYQNFPAYAVDTYVATTSSSTFLTTQPIRIKVVEDGKYNLSFLQNGTGSPVTSAVDSLVVNTYDVNGTLLNTENISNTKTNLNTLANRNVMVGCGPYNINAYTQTLSPAYDLIDSSVSYYTVQLVDISATPMSLMMTFEIDYTCNKYDQFILWWKNRLGGMDAFAFNLNSQKSVNIDRYLFNKFLPVGYAIGDRGNSVTQVNAIEQYTLNTGWLTNMEAQWLEELFTSDEVQMYATEKQRFYVPGGITEVNLTASLIINSPIIIPTGTYFTYNIQGASTLGMAEIGEGHITGFDTPNNRYFTDVPATILVGAILDGYVECYIQSQIPVIVQNSNYVRKRKDLARPLSYDINVVPSYKLNIT